ncbi:MAG: alanine racemase [Pseudomonadota bacterium]|nr:alanine racemase [Pseudomonadota bacterium]
MLKSQGILTIDLSAVRGNYALLKAHAGPKVQVGAVVKANAYGLGAVEIGTALATVGCKTFFVSSLEEGIALRQAIKTPRILVLNGFYSSGADAYAEYNLIPVIGSFLEIEGYKKLSTKHGKKLPAFLNFNIRMNRLGLGKIETERLLADKTILDGITVAGIMSHFACADEPDHPMTETQFTVFDSIARHFPAAEKSLANSSGLFRHARYHYDLARPGAALYGLNPVPEKANPMKPVARLAVPVIRVRQVYKDARVGYGGTWQAPQDTPLATVAAGYADGVFRALGNRGAMYWKGFRCPIRGRVSMDLTTVDLSAIPEGQRPKPGDWLELIGEHQTADALAADAGTIGYEVLTALGHRYEWQYVESTSP